jgi:hypothetical protein
MTHINTSTVPCIENRLISRIEAALRATAKREPAFDRSVRLAQGALVTQKERFAHEESCEVCLAAERAHS